MHILMMTVIGLALLAANKRRPGTIGDAALAFIWLWLTASVADFAIGVFVAGYSVLAELAAHAVIFGVPAGIAWFLSRRRAGKLRSMLWR